MSPIASIICGLLIDTLLVVNNYRDREADARSGKRTVIVRFGEKFGRYFYLLLGIFGFPTLPIFLTRRTYLRCPSSTTLPGSPRPHLEANGKNTQR